MKKLLPLTSFILIISATIPTLAENHFVDGIRWDERHYPAPTGQEDKPFNYSYWLEANSDETLNLMGIDTDQNEEPHLITTIHTEGDKVFFRHPDSPETSPWFLLYDFGLKAGDETEIYCCYHSKDGIPISVKVICDEVTSITNSGRQLNLMKLTATSAYHNEPIEWISGIGSLRGLLFNGGTFSLDGTGGATLLKATLDNTVLYTSPQAGVTPTLSDPLLSTAPRFKPDGTPFTPSDKGICICNGQKYLIP